MICESYIIYRAGF